MSLTPRKFKEKYSLGKYMFYCINYNSFFYSFSCLKLKDKAKQASFFVYFIAQIDLLILKRVFHNERKRIRIAFIYMCV